jgi:hypothetical protein
MLRTRAVPILLATLVVMGAVRADAQTVRATGSQRVTVKADNASLGDLIDQLAPQSTLKMIALDPADRDVRVSVEADDLPSLDAIVLALKASGLDYAMSGTRLVAGRAKKALETGGSVTWAAISSRETPTAPPALPPPQPHVDEHDLVQPVVAIPPPASGVVEMGRDQIAAPPPAAPEPEAARLSMSSAKFTSDDEFGRNLGVPGVPFIVVEDSAVITQPGFVPYKLRPDVKARRLLGIADIP